MGSEFRQGGMSPSTGTFSLPTQRPHANPEAPQGSPENPELLDLGLTRRRLALLMAPPRVDLVQNLRAARALGITPGQLLRDAFWVARGPGHPTQHEYFYYCLYDPSLPREEARRYVGRRVQKKLHHRCNDMRWYAVTQDKALFYAAASGFGLPVPRTQAAYSPGARDFAAPVIRTQETLAIFLRDPSHYPLFLKPIDGIFSLGVLSLAAVESDWIRFTTGEVARVDEVVRSVDGWGGEGFKKLGPGYLIQEQLQPHPVLRAAFGSTLPAIRFLALLSPEGATIESAVVKIPSSRNPGDNYWRAGNMLGALDEAGVIRRVVTGVGAALREISVHPETGAALVGAALPDWERALQLCLYAAAVFPGIRTQSWDIGLTEAGPVVLELNYGGDLNLHQLAHRRGVLTPSYVAHLRRFGCRLKAT